VTLAHNQCGRQDSSIRASLILCAILGLLIFAVFWPVGKFGFVDYDDQQYVANNRAIQGKFSQQQVLWAFEFHASNWHPLTWISHLLDVQFFGMNAGAHHLTNVFLHAANSILLLLVLKRMTGALWRSGFVATLFAFHPMHVESVVWVAERKDVLSTFFFMLALWAYTGYVQAKVQRPKAKVGDREPDSEGQGTSGQANRRAWLNYSLAILFFILGLLSKPMLVTLPFILLLLDYWPLQRFQIKNQKSKIKKFLPLLREKIPFFLLAFGSSVVTFLAQRSGGSVASLQLFSFEARIANALAAYAGYLEKLIYPAKLAVPYLPPAQWPFSHLVVALMIIAGITVAALWHSNNLPYLIVGWLWFLGTLVPVIGLVQVGSQYMADRYSYVPFIGCFICVAWGAWDLAKSNGVYWQDKAASHPSPRSSPVARGERESLSVRRGESIGETAAAPVGSTTKGLLWLMSLVLIGAAVLVTRNQLQYWRSSESLFRHCVEVTADNYVAYNNLGAILVNQGKYTEAKPFYTQALGINPGFADTVMNMGTLLALEGDATNAVLYLQRAVRLAPDSAECHGKLAVALAQQGRIEEAVAAYRESLRLKLDQVPACNNLAWILATNPDVQLRDGVEAVRLAEHACQLTDYKQPMLVGTLAAAYAETGRFDEAVRMADTAIALANASGQTEIVRKNGELKTLYESGRAYREASK
jgi:Flp pilus assembly protein TadD